MKSWKQQIPGGFAATTAPFASHPNDRDRAFAMLSVMIQENVKWEEAKDEVLAYLHEQKVTGEALDKQMKRVEDHLKPWLN